MFRLNRYNAFMPVNTWLILGFVLLACVNTHNKDVWRAEDRGQLPEGDHAPAGWLWVLFIPQFGLLVWLAMLDWQQALSVTVITFLLAVFLRPVMTLIGVILLIPYALATRRQRLRR